MVLLAGGALACFLGYRVFRLVLAIYGFVLGALVTTSFLAPVETSWTLLGVVAGGLAGAAVLILAYFVGVAFVGAAVAALLVHLVWTRIGGDPHPLVVVLSCVLGALAATAVERHIVVLGTAFAGAWTALAGGLLLIGHQVTQGGAAGEGWITYPLNPAPGHEWLLWAWLVLGAVGTLVQLQVVGTGGARARLRSRTA